jgi:hypothetical protein
MITHNRESQTIKYSLHEFGIIFSIENNLVGFVFAYSMCQIIFIIGKDYTFYECFILHLSCLQGYLFLMFSHS